MEKLGKEIAAIEGRLNNKGFVAKAPVAVIEETRQKLDDLKATADKVSEARARLTQ